MKKCIACVSLIFTTSATAAFTPIPDALKIREMTARQDVHALQKVLQDYQLAFEANAAAERPLIQAYLALRGNTDTRLEEFYDRWVAQYPKSYEARVARANYAWGRASLIAHPKAIRGGVQAESAWQQYSQFEGKARKDLEIAQTLSRHPLQHNAH